MLDSVNSSNESQMDDYQEDSEQADLDSDQLSNFVLVIKAFDARSFIKHEVNCIRLVSKDKPLHL